MQKNGNGIFPGFDVGDEILEKLINERACLDLLGGKLSEFITFMVNAPF